MGYESDFMLIRKPKVNVANSNISSFCQLIVAYQQARGFSQVGSAGFLNQSYDGLKGVLDFSNLGYRGGWNCKG